MSMTKKMGRRLVALLVMGMAGAACAAGLEWWAVPAMSGEIRLPDTTPTDGVPGGTVRFVAAKGEYEPASFVVRADRDLGKVQVTLGELRNEWGDVFPTNRLDLKVIKVWLQNRNAWFSFFADTGTKPCPELLLNDEDLIRVDYAKKANYARVKGADGKTQEWWLNPPRLMDKRYYDHYRDTTPFAPMREGFSDAKTLQPVLLEKGKAKQFFLTAHVTPDIPAGLYKGEIKIRGQRAKVESQTYSIPVALRVLDFALPKPKAYLHPEMDFYVCFYDYISRELIMAMNGGNEPLMWKQLEAILADSVAHGQDMKWIHGGGTGSVEADRTIAIMKKVGMRTDPIVGCVDFVWNENSPAQATARAYRIADYYDGLLGHHNLYGAYGDEPGSAFFLKSRVVFDSYLKAGLRFIIASREHIVNQVGFKWYWHNASNKPTDTGAPELWNQMGSDTHCAWYADQHVGCENPEFNRRQNGLGAYLSGYSALCNYAHHLGPYNDDSDTYKPMVFAYGCSDGVIDTLQWEGFREGIDDIRYATLMTALAREANKSDDIDVRHLGRKALLLLTVFNRETGDLNVARGEMIAYIEKLRGALGYKANQLDFATVKPLPLKRPPLEELQKPEPEKIMPNHPNQARKLADEWVVRNDLKGAIGVWERMYEFGKKNKQDWIMRDSQRGIAGLYAKFYRPIEAAQYLKGVRDYVGAAGYLYGRSEAYTAEANRLVEGALKDALAHKDVPKLNEAWGFLLGHGNPLAVTRAEEVAKILKPADMANSLLHTATGLGVCFQGNWSRIKQYFDLALKLDGANTNRVWSFKHAQYGYQAYLVAGDAKQALWLCDKALEAAARKDKRVPYRPEDVYFFELAKAVTGVRGEKAVADALAAADGKFGAALAPKLRKERIERLAAFRLCARDEAFARGASAYLAKMMPAQPDKTYVVKYSARRIGGLGGWAQAAAQVKPDVAVLDRAYGGDTTYLWTDVSTGRGEVTQDLTKRYARNPEWQAMADSWGIHFRMEVFDEKAREIAEGFVSAGSLEGYIAPGENTPYVCLLHSFKPGGFEVYNGVYSQKNHRWVSQKDRVNCREDIAYTDNSVVIYWAFSWNVYATRIPTNGAIWDFEPMLWGRKSCMSWNGLKTVHGRSSWGHLKFALSDKDRTQILRPVLINARANYEAQKKSYAKNWGVIEHWKNPEVGDPSFYETVLKPIVEKLDVESAKVKPEMDDATVNALAKDVLPTWHDFIFDVQELRAKYLLDAKTR